MEYDELEKTFGRLADWYYANKNQIDTGHEGEYVLLYQTDVKGYFASEDKAELYAMHHGFTEGAYLIHECDLDEKPIFMPNFEESFA